MKTRGGLCLFLVNAVVVAVFWQLVPGEWTPEANEGRDYAYFYAPVAKNLAGGKGLVTENGRLATLYPPGYPLMLAGLLRLADWTGHRTTSCSLGSR
jgi:hypothetical protein